MTNNERFTLRIAKELKSQLDIRRTQMGISLNALVVQILWDWVERKNNGADRNLAARQDMDQEDTRKQLQEA